MSRQRRSNTARRVGSQLQVTHTRSSRIALARIYRDDHARSGEDALECPRCSSTQLAVRIECEACAAVSELQVEIERMAGGGTQ
jgi:hypothetical protein